MRIVKASGTAKNGYCFQFIDEPEFKKYVDGLRHGFSYFNDECDTEACAVLLNRMEEKARRFDDVDGFEFSVFLTEEEFIEFALNTGIVACCVGVF